MRKALVALAFIAMASSSQAELISNEEFCDIVDFSSPARQTIVVIDGRLITPEINNERLPENLDWRRRVAEFLDASDPSIDQRFAPRERVTILATLPDGSGFERVFHGCMPGYTRSEQEALQSEVSTFDFLFGRDWKRKLKKSQEAFRSGVVLGLVQPALGDISAPPANELFVESGLIKALAQGGLVSLPDGAPRLIIFTDLGSYSFTGGDVVSARKAGRQAADRIGLDLQRSEVFVFGAKGSKGRQQAEAFFLASAGKVEAFTGASGSFSTNNPPETVEVYQGRIKYPDGAYPIRMRLALDQNGTAVNSWLEVQSDRKRFTPFGGLLTCDGADNCSFVGDRVLAQIWSDNPDPDPECAVWMPFAGLRELEFQKSGNIIQGKINDSACYVTGMEDGLKFEMNKLDNGIF